MVVSLPPEEEKSQAAASKGSDEKIYSTSNNEVDAPLQNEKHQHTTTVASTSIKVAAVTNTTANDNFNDNNNHGDDDASHTPGAYHIQGPDSVISSVAAAANTANTINPDNFNDNNNNSDATANHQPGAHHIQGPGSLGGVVFFVPGESIFDPPPSSASRRRRLDPLSEDHEDDSTSPSSDGQQQVEGYIPPPEVLFEENLQNVLANPNVAPKLDGSNVTRVVDDSSFRKNRDDISSTTRSDNKHGGMAAFKSCIKSHSCLLLLLVPAIITIATPLIYTRYGKDNGGGLTVDETNLAMVIAGKVGGIISIIGSSFIIRDVWKRYRTLKLVRRQQGDNNDDEEGGGEETIMPVTVWMVLQMSVADIGTSFFGFFLGSWMVQAGEGFPLAAGNDATCRAQAFIFSLFIGSGNLTNGLLALTYWLAICRSMSEEDFQTKKWRSIQFGVPWAYGLFWASISWTLISPNDVPMVWYCYAVAGEPGSTFHYLWGVFLTFSFVIIFVLVLYCMASLTWFIYKAEKRTDASRIRTSREISRDRTTQMSKQGLLYTAAWLAIVIPMFVNGIEYIFIHNADYDEYHKVFPHWYYVLFACIFPLQGFLNAIVYFRPKVVGIQREHPDLSSYTCTLRALNIC